MASTINEALSTNTRSTANASRGNGEVVRAEFAMSAVSTQAVQQIAMQSARSAVRDLVFCSVMKQDSTLVLGAQSTVQVKPKQNLPSQLSKLVQELQGSAARSPATSLTAQILRYNCVFLRDGTSIQPAKSVHANKPRNTARHGTLAENSANETLQPKDLDSSTLR